MAIFILPCALLLIASGGQGKRASPPPPTFPTAVRTVAPVDVQTTWLTPVMARTSWTQQSDADQICLEIDGALRSCTPGGRGRLWIDWSLPGQTVALIEQWWENERGGEEPARLLRTRWWGPYAAPPPPPHAVWLPVMAS